MTRLRRRICQSSVVMLVVAVGLVLVPQTASASTANTDRFNESWTYTSTALGVCLDFNLTGSFKYNVSRTAVEKGPVQFSLTSILLTDAVLTVNVHGYAARDGCLTASAKLSKISFAEHWTGYSCSFNPSVSVSIPWGVSVGGWPDCGNRSQASSSSSDSAGSTFTQDNAGSSPAFAKVTSTSGAPTPCYGVYVSAKPYLGTTNDVYSSANSASSKKFCLSPTY